MLGKSSCCSFVSHANAGQQVQGVGRMTAAAAESRLSYLLAMEPVEIDADLAKYQGRMSELIEDIRSLLHRPREQRTAEVEARIAHLRLIQAHEFCADETLPVEVRTFYAALGAEKVAQDAGIAAFEKGSLAQLSREMEEMKQRVELTDEEAWMRGEDSADYRRLAARQKETVERIEQTLIAFSLRRYGLTRPADLYENDRATFEVQREVGRILMMEGGAPPTEKELLEGYLGKRYGRDAVQRVLSRLQEIRSAA